jgi:hypothetical protein
MSVKQINNCADRLEQIVEEMQELLDEAGTLITEIDTHGELAGSDLNLEFKNYIRPHLQIRIGEDGGGYMSNEKGLGDMVNRAREVADEMEHMQD